MKIDIHTDGSCIGNPGPGGWAAILVCPSKELVLQGCEKQTTNNRMELTAVINAIKALKAPCEVTVYTDSVYVARMNRDTWLKWAKKPKLPNRDLWEMLIRAGNAGHHKIRFQKVQAHSGNAYNERCDMIAREQAHIACRK